MSWAALERGAPGLAGLGRARLEESGVALLATLRRDGWPRISPVEPYVFDGQLLFGAMSWSLKARDLRRDPRCSLHSAVSAPDAGEAELKLYGRAVVAEDAVRDACTDGWWQDHPREAAAVFGLAIEQAALVTWDIGQGRMMVRRWSPARGETTSDRRYP